MNVDTILNNSRNGVTYVNPNPSNSKKHFSPKMLTATTPDKIAELSAQHALWS